MNILAIDFGTKNIGLAWTDTEIGVVLPFGLVGDINELVKVIDKEKIGLVVVGLPLGLNGKENKNTERVSKFIRSLKEIISVPIEIFDERFSSKAADKIGGEASRDERAAMIILSDYFNSKKL